MEKNLYTLKDIQKMLEGFKKPRTIRTLRTWFKEVPDMRPGTKPLVYSKADVTKVLSDHGINDPMLIQLKRLDDKSYESPSFDDTPHVFGEDGPEDDDEADAFVEKHFDEYKEELLFKFILERLGFSFQDLKLKKDLRHLCMFKMTTPKVYGGIDPKTGKSDLKPALKNMNDIMDSVKRLDSLDARYYIRKVRSDKKNK